MAVKQHKLHEIFTSLQDQMISSLSSNRKVIIHPGSKGSASENKWKTLLNDYLPERYKAEPAFVIDSNGSLSEQIDIVIFDRQYSPFLFNQDGILFVPAESVYACIEIKQEISRKNIIYAGQKVSSVRKLQRTSASIPHAGGKFKPKQPFKILSIFLSLESSWKQKPLGDPFIKSINKLSSECNIDLGCVLNTGSFCVNDSGTNPEIHLGKNHLMYFFFKLMSKLQSLGTSVAIDYDKYAELIDSVKKK